FDETLVSEPLQKLLHFANRSRFIDIEFVNHTSHDTISIKAFPDHCPDTASCLVELENLIRCNMYQHRCFIQAFCNDVAVRSQYHVQNHDLLPFGMASIIHPPSPAKLHADKALPVDTVLRYILRERLSAHIL